jgi:phage baseplate assembly protein W
MPVYVGFNTININQPRTFVRSGVDGGIGSITQSPRVGKKFRLYDDELVIRDFCNALSIKQGEIVGNPSYGTTLWNYVFEPNTDETRNAIENEVRRVASQDPRLTINTLQLFDHAEGILIELQVTVNLNDSTVQLGFLLNRDTGQAQLLT